MTNNLHHWRARIKTFFLPGSWVSSNLNTDTRICATLWPPNQGEQWNRLLYHCVVRSFKQNIGYRNLPKILVLHFLISITFARSISTIFAPPILSRMLGKTRLKNRQALTNFKQQWYQKILQVRHNLPEN